MASCSQDTADAAGGEEDGEGGDEALLVIRPCSSSGGKPHGKQAAGAIAQPAAAASQQQQQSKPLPKYYLALKEMWPHHIAWVFPGEGGRQLTIQQAVEVCTAWGWDKVPRSRLEFFRDWIVTGICKPTKKVPELHAELERR